MAEVSIYPGCTAHSTGLEYGLSMYAVLGALGVETREIDDWNCCGGAAAHSLSNLLGLSLPARNVAKAQLSDLPLLVPCPGCFNAVRRAQYALENDPDMKARLEEIIGFTYKGGLQVQAMHDIILDTVGVDRLKEAVSKPLTGLKVVCYYGCLLVRDPKVVKQGDHENPTFLDELATTVGAEALDWSYKTDCCGADLAFTHGKTAVERADELTGMALEAGADCILCTCGLCQINLDSNQSGKNGKKLPILYLTELIGVALDLPRRTKWWRLHIVNPRPMLRTKDLL